MGVKIGMKTHWTICPHFEAGDRLTDFRSEVDCGTCLDQMRSAVMAATNTNNRMSVISLVEDVFKAKQRFKHCQDSFKSLKDKTTDYAMDHLILLEMTAEVLMIVQNRLWKARDITMAREKPSCHAGTDGDCSWRLCPQRFDYKGGCPLHDWSEQDG